MEKIGLSKSFLIKNFDSYIVLKNNNFYIEIKNRDEKKRLLNLSLLITIFEFTKLNYKFIFEKDFLLNGYINNSRKEDFIELEKLHNSNIVCFDDIEDIKKIINFSMYTLTFLLKDNQILLGLKKRGLGKNYYNGFGGKVENNESVIDAAKREVWEECNIYANTLIHKAKLYFVFENSTKPNIEGFVFLCNDFSGSPLESEEMVPVWFKIPERVNLYTINDLLQSIPFHFMWKDDIYWLPFFLSDNFIKGFFILNDDNDLIFTQLSIEDM